MGINFLHQICVITRLERICFLKYGSLLLHLLLASLFDLVMHHVVSSLALDNLTPLIFDPLRLHDCRSRLRVHQIIVDLCVRLDFLTFDYFEVAMRLLHKFHSDASQVVQ